MTIELSHELEQIVHDAVKAGLYVDEDDVIRDALIKLNQTISQATRTSRKNTRRTKDSPKPNNPLTPEELDQYLLSIGLITQLPDPAQDVDDDDPEDVPIVIKGEPLSETIIRERR
jgi:Arc/MetJ-type ribon-helix-helix transcriptional regulator